MLFGYWSCFFGNTGEQKKVEYIMFLAGGKCVIQLPTKRQVVAFFSFSVSKLNFFLCNLTTKHLFLAWQVVLDVITGNVVPYIGIQEANSQIMATDVE